MLALATLDSPAQEWVVHTHMCDASAGLCLGPNQFVAANDEDNVLRIYNALTSGGPVREIDLTDFLQVDPKHPETDIEGAAQVGSTVYWITSHGRNKDGKFRESRNRFFATKLVSTEGGTTLAPDGQPYRKLLEDLLSDPRLRAFNLAAASALPPKDPGALNIEGLCAGPDGRLLIGFRNPIPRGKALLVPLLNPAEMVAGKRALLGEAVLLDLGGLGVRDMVGTGNDYWIIGGAHDGKGGSKLFRWKGGTAPPELRNDVRFKKFNSESVMAPPSSPNRLLMLSDDGTRNVEGQDCKLVEEVRLRRFRSMWVDQEAN